MSTVELELLLAVHKGEHLFLAPERQGAAWELENPASYEALFLLGGIVDTDRASV